MQSVQTFDNADAIVRKIIEHCEGNIRLALPLGLGKANTIVNALTKAAVEDTSIHLEIFTALTLERPGDQAGNDLQKRFLDPAQDRLFGRYPALHYAELLHRGELPGNIEVSEFFLLAGKWKGVERVQQNYISANYTHAYDFLVARKPNVVAQLLARGDDCFSLSCNTDITADLVSDRANGKMDFLLAGEVNSELPFMSGEAAEIGSDQVDLLLENSQSDFELFSAVKQPIGDVEMAIGLHVSRLIEDGGTIQIGIGSIGDAVAHALLLRHNDPETWIRIIRECPFNKHESDGEKKRRDSGTSRITQHSDDLTVSGIRFEQGLYSVTEMLVDGLLQLYTGGILKREVDGAAVHAGFFVESRAFYKTLRDMPVEQRAKIVMKPVSFTNQLYGNEAEKRAARIKARFVNNAMMVTLSGSVVSDGTGDGQVVSGVGGQFNFVTQAFALKDARSIITVKASREGNSGPQSNIVWNYPHTTIPRHLKDVVITEYGIADLRGRPDSDTVSSLLDVTDSRFQNELLAKAQEEGKIGQDYRISDECCTNTPEKLKQWLRPYRVEGSLPRYPFGTDFSKIEQRLIPALSMLKSAQNSKLKLAGLGWSGLTGQVSESDRACLKRMGLDAPAGMREHALALLLKGALQASADNH